VDEEENQAFPLIKKNSSPELLREMSRDFMEAKKRIQENVGVDEIISSAANTDADAELSSDQPRA
jgi:hypothetical protein